MKDEDSWEPSSVMWCSLTSKKLLYAATYNGKIFIVSSKAQSDYHVELSNKPNKSL